MHNGVLVTKEEYEQALLTANRLRGIGNTSFERLVVAFCGEDIVKAQIEKPEIFLKRSWEDGWKISDILALLVTLFVPLNILLSVISFRKTSGKQEWTWGI